MSVSMYNVGREGGTYTKQKSLLVILRDSPIFLNKRLDLNEILSEFQELRQINRILLDLFPSSLPQRVTGMHFCILVHLGTR